ncbi:Golgi-to-ER vesicle coat component [Savitreella phatthalungensis]
MSLGLYTISQLIVLDNAGDRLFFRQFTPPHPTTTLSHSPPTPSAQRAFEKDISDKAHKQNGDVMVVDGKVVCYKSSVDICVYGVGGSVGVEEFNEVMLYNGVVTVKEAMEVVLKGSVDKRALLDNYDVLAIVVDEVVDAGIILETDPITVATRVSRQPAAGDLPIPLDFSERGLLNAYQMAKQKFADRILQG